MSRHTKYKQIDIDYIVRRYNEGVSSNEIAKEVGVSRATITNRLKAEGVAMNHKYHPEKDNLYDDRDWLYNEYINKDKTMKEIADMFDISIAPIYTRLKKFEIYKSEKPSDNNTYLILKCDNCDNEFKRTKRNVNHGKKNGNKNFFCTTDCNHEFYRGRPNPKKGRKREDNGCWKGGVSTVNENIRSSISEWVKKTLKEQDYICYVTGQRGGTMAVHHVTPFHKIRDGILKELGMDGNKPINNYSSEQVEELKNKVIKAHEVEKGIVLREDIHVQFHHKYGFDSNLDALEEFKQHYLDGEYNEVQTTS